MPNVPRVKGSVEKLVSKDRKVFVSSWIVGNALTVKMVEDQRDSVDKLLDESGLTEFSSQTYFDCYGWPELKPFIRTIQK